MHVDCFPHCQKSRCLSLWEKNRHLTHNDKKLDLKTFRYQLEYTAIMLQCTLINLRGRWQENNSSGINILGVHCTNINHELVICRTVILLKSALSFGHTQWSLIGLSQEKNKKIVGYFDLFGMAFVFFGQIYLVPLLCVCVFIPSPVRVGTLLMEVPGTPIGASFFEFELKPTGKDSADPTQHEFQHHIL